MACDMGDYFITSLEVEHLAPFHLVHRVQSERVLPQDGVAVSQILDVFLHIRASVACWDIGSNHRDQFIFLGKQLKLWLAL